MDMCCARAARATGGHAPDAPLGPCDSRQSSSNARGPRKERQVIDPTLVDYISARGYKRLLGGFGHGQVGL